MSTLRFGSYEPFEVWTAGEIATSCGVSRQHMEKVLTDILGDYEVQVGKRKVKLYSKTFADKLIKENKR